METGEANLRAVAPANPIGLVTPMKAASLPELMKPAIGSISCFIERGPGGAPAQWAKAKLVRYADDFVVLARYQGSRLI